MTYRIPLPEGGRTAHLDLVDPYATAVQRLIRRSGLASFEPETAAALLALFEQADPGFVLYDVGANVGVYSAMAAVMFSPEAVHSFEPSPTTARMLSKITRANGANVTIHECALSDADGEATLFLSPASDASNSMVEGFRDATGEVTVATRRLDDVVAETGVAPTIIKIDVETHEPAVLAGARKTLAAHRPYVVIEVLYRSKRDLGAPIGDVFADLGYSFYALDSTPDWRPADRITGRKGSARDWLLAPEPLSDDFVERWSVWHQRYLACDLRSNPRPPIIKSARRAFERGGSRKMLGTAWRFVSGELVPSFASSVRRGRSRVQQRIRKPLVGLRRFFGRRVILPLLATGPARRATLFLAARRYAFGDRIGKRIDAFLVTTQPTAGERAALSRSLVELFFDLIPAAGTSVFVEAGAKEAAASVRAMESGVPIVVAFEANPYTHRRFAANVEAAGLDYRHAALATEPGEITFLVRLREDGSAIADGQGSILVRPDHQPGYEEATVRAVTLDDQIDGDGRIAMWVDVEGAVAEVFGGGDRVLRRTDLLIVEVETARVWSGQQWLAGDVEAFLADLGLEAVARDMQSRRQFNMLFVRSGLLEASAVTSLLGRWRSGV